LRNWLTLEWNTRRRNKRHKPGAMIRETRCGDGTRLVQESRQRRAVQERSLRIASQACGELQDVTEPLRAAGRDDQHAETQWAGVLERFVQSNLPLSASSLLARKVDQLSFPERP
jgi:hypothetical protein